MWTLVDLRKAYDRIDRNFLIYAMQRKGISGKFLATVQAMLQTIEQIPKIGHILLSSILKDTGLKYRHYLSPLELGDVKDIFCSKYDPVHLFPDITLSVIYYQLLMI